MDGNVTKLELDIGCDTGSNHCKLRMYNYQKQTHAGTPRYTSATISNVPRLAGMRLDTRTSNDACF